MSLALYQSLLDAYGCAPVEDGEPALVLVGAQRIHLQFIADEEEEESRLMARTDVLHLAHPPSVQVCCTLLQANAFWSGIQGGALGLRGSQVVMLSVSQRLGSLDVESLTLMLQEMSEDARRWASFLQFPAISKPLAPPWPGLMA